MQIITVAVIKGGTGKTTTAAALATAGAGGRTLVIDLDPQGNLTAILGGDVNKPGAVELLHGAEISTTIQQAGGIDIIGGSRGLSRERTAPGSANRLKAALQPVQGLYDLVIIDTPPMLGELLYNALNASTGLLIPLEAEGSSLQGLYQIVKVAEQIQQSNPKLKVLGTVITRYNPRGKIYQFYLEAIRAKGAEINAPLLGTIRAGIAVPEAATMRQPLTKYAPKSKATADYNELYRRITEVTENEKI